MQRNNKNLGLKYLMVLCCSTSLSLGTFLSVKAENIDDIRELAGIQRKDSIYSSADRAMIMLENKKRETHNRIALILEMSNPKDLNDINSKKRKELTSLANEAKSRYLTSLSDGSSVDVILENKSTYDNVNYALGRVPADKKFFSMEIKSNPYKNKALEIEKILKEIKGYKDIGITGKYLLSPVETGFNIVAPFPYKVDPKTGGYVRNNGVDLKAPKGSLVVSVWNGVVSRVEKGKDGLYKVEVTHDANIKTVYSNLYNLKVRKGDKVKQFHHIAEVGKTKPVSHLHFEVWVDGSPVNPMYFFGAKGRDALSNFVATSDDILYKSMSDVVMRIKDSVKGKKDVYVGGYYSEKEIIATDKTPELDKGHKVPNSIGELLDVPYR